ncbi:MAG: TlpA disulfide reductase family protein [Flavobacteriales bacterium]|jgi:cytochrome c biogenesis protein CcmG/thiol:disulfide interchange protein DsbE|nr:TlpA family protein disulfide reductase [bacterium]
MMKEKLFVLIFISSLSLVAQEKLNVFPSVDIKNIEGKIINTDEFDNGGKPIIVSFWATWCKPCAKELDAISEVYDEWQDETGVKLLAISIDDARNTAKIAPFANGKDWPYEVYLDANSDLKRALNVNAIPHTFLLNGKKEIVWQHTSYFDGDEDELFEEVQKLH